jgi:beta-aspartyl-peptidase (threonine type)
MNSIKSNKLVLAIHGGAGKISRDEKNQEKVKASLDILDKILVSGYQALIGGASALDAVMQAVMQLEDREYFNAGHGSVLTSAGHAEMDAAIMDGKTRLAGAVACVERIKNPVRGARAVMDYSDHVLLTGVGAEYFCQQQGLELVDPSYFVTPHRLHQLHRFQQTAAPAMGEDFNLDTVGAIALDLEGHLAAATSTGGKMNKLPGRIGDAPIVGAGTWADDATCAVSVTGDGETIMRCALAHEIDALIRHRNLGLHQACEQAMQGLNDFGGLAGCIAVNKIGEVVLIFNTEAMYRGWVNQDGSTQVAIFA